MQTGRDVAESHREDAADKGRCGRDAAARESHLEDAAGRGTVAELLTCTGHQRRLAGTWRRAIGKMLLPVGGVAEMQT